MSIESVGSRFNHIVPARTVATTEASAPSSEETATDTTAERMRRAPTAESSAEGGSDGRSTGGSTVAARSLVEIQETSRDGRSVDAARVRQAYGT